MALIVGGPFDGGQARGKRGPWQDEIVCAHLSDDSTRMAIYHRQDDGSYQFEKIVDEDELRKVE